MARTDMILILHNICQQQEALRMPLTLTGEVTILTQSDM